MMNNSNTNSEAAAADNCCASCGVAEVGDVKLKECDGCDLVRYCSDACQEDHISRHLLACKKRAAELRDEILFRQPESTHMGDCPICCEPLPLDYKKSVLQTCSKLICDGCSHAYKRRQLQQNMQPTCLFCRRPVPKTQEEIHKNRTKRVEANDPAALREFAMDFYLNGDYDGALKYFTKAAELGNADADADAHHVLSFMYMKGQGVEKDGKKELYHLEEAAIGGHPEARYKIGCVEMINDKIERTVKHFTIAASLGHDGSIVGLKDCYQAGDIRKDAFAAALRAHHAAVNATKTPQREEAAKADFRLW